MSDSRRQLPDPARDDDAPPPPDGPVLYLMSGVRGAGFLLLPQDDADPVTVELKPAQLRLLYVLVAAWAADQGLAPAIRGWRLAEQLGDAVGDLLPDLLPVCPNTVVSYASHIHQLVVSRVEARGAADPIPTVIERERGKGYRLGLPDLTLVDLPARRKRA